jgi:hypothetical protein
MSPEELEQRKQLMDTAITEVGNAFNALSDALRAHDFQGITAACTRLGNSGQDLNDVLPVPSPKMAALIQGAVERIAATERACQAIGPYSTEADFSSLMTQMSQLKNYMQNPG